MDPHKYAVRPTSGRPRAASRWLRLLALVLGASLGLLAGIAAFVAGDDEDADKLSRLLESILSADSTVAAVLPEASMEAETKLAIERRQLGLTALHDKKYDKAAEYFILALESPHPPPDTAGLLGLAKTLKMEHRAVGTEVSPSGEVRPPGTSRAIPKKQAPPQTRSRVHARARPPPSARLRLPARHRTRAERDRAGAGPATPRSGIIRLPTIPPGLIIRVDGEARNRSLSRLEVTPGRHEIAILRGDRVLLRRQIEVLAGRYVSLEEDDLLAQTAETSAESARSEAPAKAKPRPKSPPPTGQALSRKRIGGVLKRVMPRVRQCYERELTSNPWLSGEVIAEIEATANGAVQRVYIRQTSLDSKATVNCIVRLLQHVEFPPSPRGRRMRFSVPLAFEPEAP